MSIKDIIFAAIVLVTVIVVIVAVRAAVISIKRKLRQASELLGQIQAATQETASTPRTLSGSEGLMLMRISKDFPEFNADAARQIVQSVLAKYFTILNSRTGTSQIEDRCTDAFINELEAKIISESKVYNDPKIHKTVISDYSKTHEEAVITFQSAVEYRFEGKLTSQHVYETKYIYFLEENSLGENVSLICENCGAPVSTLGSKVCEYCGAEIKASIERTWKINKIVKTR